MFKFKRPTAQFAKQLVEPRKIAIQKPIRNSTLEDFRKSLDEYKRIETIKHFKNLIHTDVLELKDISSVIQLISTYHNPLKDLKWIKKIIDYSLQKNLKLNSRDHHSILKIFYRSAEHQSLCEYIETMRYEFNHKCDLVSFNYLIASLYSKGDFKGAITVFEEACTVHPVLKYLNQDGWAFVLNAHSKLGNQSQVEQLYQLCKSKLKDLDTSILDEGYIKASNDMNRIQKVFAEMKPSLTAYDAIIEATATTSLVETYWKELLDYCDSLDREKRIPKLESLEYTIDFLTGRTSLSKTMRPRNTLPLTSSLTSIISYYYDTQQHAKVKEIFKKYYPLMELDPRIYEFVCRAHWESQEYDLASNILFLMVQKSYKPSDELFLMLKEYRAARTRLGVAGAVQLVNGESVEGITQGVGAHVGFIQGYEDEESKLDYEFDSRYRFDF